MIHIGAEISEIRAGGAFGRTSSAKIVDSQLVIEKSGCITAIEIDEIQWVKRLEIGTDPSGPPQFIVELRDGAAIYLPATREAREFVVALCRKAGILERFLAHESRKRRIEIVMIVMLFAATGIGCVLYLLMR